MTKILPQINPGEVASAVLAAVKRLDDWEVADGDDDDNAGDDTKNEKAGWDRCKQINKGWGTQNF